MTSLAVIVPTVGRPTLRDTLASIGELEPGDQVIVAADGVQLSARAALNHYRQDGLYYLEIKGPPSSYGNLQRDAGMAAAKADWLLFMDDDDEYVPGALATVRHTVEQQPGRPHIFRARWGAGHHASGVTLWKERELTAGNIATPMVVLPNRRYATSWLDSDAEGIRGWTSDFRFLSQAIGEAGEPVWCQDVIALVRPLPPFTQLYPSG